MKQTTATANIAPLAIEMVRSVIQTQETNWTKQLKGIGTIAEDPLAGAPLTASEQGYLEEYETILEHGLATFFEVGNALLQIRENRLYRSAHQTFEQYCQARWSIGRSYAWRLIGAAERINLLPGDSALPRPSSEFQIRPFLKLAPGEFPGAWRRAVRIAKQGKVTPSIAQTVIRERLPNGDDRAGATLKLKRYKSRGKLPIGQILVLLYETKRRIEKGETEQALASLDQIESVLCGTG